MENECETLPGVAYPGVQDNRSTINTKTGYDMMMMMDFCNIYLGQLSCGLPSPVLAVRNVTAYPSMVTVPITMILSSAVFNVAIKGLNTCNGWL